MHEVWPPESKKKPRDERGFQGGHVAAPQRPDLIPLPLSALASLRSVGLVHWS